MYRMNSRKKKLYMYYYIQIYIFAVLRHLKYKNIEFAIRKIAISQCMTEHGICYFIHLTTTTMCTHRNAHKNRDRERERNYKVIAINRTSEASVSTPEFTNLIIW